MSDIVTEADLRWERVKTEAARAISTDGAMDPAYVKALAELADLFPELIKLAAEPKVNQMDLGDLCGHAPHVCILPAGHDDVPDLLAGSYRDPEATHSQGGTKWRWDRHHRTYEFGWF